MRSFACRTCGQLVFFENTACLTCGAELGYWSRDRELLTLTVDGAALRPLGQTRTAPWTLYRCANFRLAGCNWLVGDLDRLCASCELTRTRPNDYDAAGMRALLVAEGAKRHLMFELGELGLPVATWRERPGGLGFDLLSSAEQPVTTGHSNGIITLDLAESEDAHREARREQLGEPYRTVLGHLRHEIGHYYWPILVAEGARRDRFRELFGDEGSDYQRALDRHYEQGPPADWEGRHVSAYAAMHPAEDWAETFAHYLHIRDTLQTAAAFGVTVAGPDAVPAGERNTELASSPQDVAPGFEGLLEDWLPLTYAINALNRSMGRDELYPFVLSPAVIGKLAFVHELVS
jgi:hypothetical protein